MAKSIHYKPDKDQKKNKSHQKLQLLEIKLGAITFAALIFQFILHSKVRQVFVF